jgi:hypothetical protein
LIVVERHGEVVEEAERLVLVGPEPVEEVARRTLLAPTPMRLTDRRTILRMTRMPPTKTEKTIPAMAAARGF